MKTSTEYLTFNVKARRGLLNITPKIQALVSKSQIMEGLCLVNAMHITASVFINDDEEGLHSIRTKDPDKFSKKSLLVVEKTVRIFNQITMHRDYEEWLEGLAPHEPVSRYRHNDTGEDNADAHLKRQVMGREVVVAVTDGRLDFGPWEQIFYGEFDGRRSKKVLVKIIGQ